MKGIPNPLVAWTCLLLLVVWSAPCGRAQQPQPQPIHYSVQDFVLAALQNDTTTTNTIRNDTFWLINVRDFTPTEHSDELLFVVDSASPTHAKYCQRGCRPPPGQDCPADHSATGTTFIQAVGIIGYFRPGLLQRWCLWQDGIIDSFQSRKWLQATTVSQAPSLKDLVATIDERGPSETCIPPGHRGIFWETLEILCFALGHKPALIRQRQIHNPNGGHHTLGLLQGVPASLFVPHTRLLLEWILTKTPVWRGLSKVTWDVQDQLLFEHSIILSHAPVLGQQLVDLKVQDASVPAQPSVEATAHYIAQVGAALGYTRREVKNYLETSAAIAPEHRNQSMMDQAMARAFDNNDQGDDNRCIAEGGEGEQQESCRPNHNPSQQTYPELANFRAFLESDEALHVSTKLFHQVMEPLDDIFVVI